MKDLSIVIVTYNSQSEILKCLNSIEEQSSIDHEVIVVDNASMDDTCLQVAGRFPAVLLIRNEENLGFAAACNVGIERSVGRHVSLVNPDAEILDGALDKMVAFLDEYPSYGMVGPKVVTSNGSLSMVGARRFPSGWWDMSKRQIGELIGLSLDHHHLMKDWDHMSSREVDALTGACMVVRREAIEAAGMLDPYFFLMVEDVEWCRRIRDAGWPAYYYADAEVLHDAGHSMGALHGEIFVEKNIGRHYYLKKYHGSVQAEILRTLIRVFGTFHLLVSGLRGWVRGNSPSWSKRLALVKLIILWRSPFRTSKTQKHT